MKIDICWFDRRENVSTLKLEMSEDEVLAIVNVLNGLISSGADVTVGQGFAEGLSELLNGLVESMERKEDEDYEDDD